MRDGDGNGFNRGGHGVLAQHGYRDQYPRRDAAEPEAFLHVYVKDGRRRLGIRSVGGKVRRLHFEKLKQVVVIDEQNASF